jgi:hypothetical protein
MLTILHRAVAGVAVAVLLAGMIGCSNKVAEQVAAMNTSNSQRLANMYSAYQNFRGGQGPTDESELKKFIQEYDPARLKMMGIDPDKLDALFTSERDHKPFKIRYKVGGGRGSVAAVVFEQEGVGGKKQVAYTGNTKVEEVDDATYQQLLAGKGSSQPPAGERSPNARGGRSSERPPGAPTGPPGSGSL